MEFDEIVVKESPGLCRCCLSEGCYKDMGTEYSWMNENEVYADMLLECFDIGISQHNEGPNGPNRLICEVCITRLRDACNFKKQVLDSEKKFVDMIGRGEFRPKVLIYQSQMKSEANDETARDDTEVEYLEDIDFGDADDEPLKNEASASDIAVEMLPVPKRGRPRKALKVEKKKAKLDERPRSSKTLVKGAVSPAGGRPLTATRRNRLMKRNAVLVLEHSTALPFKWHRQNFLCFFCHKTYKDTTLLKEHTKEHKRSSIKSSVSYLRGDEKVKIDVTVLKCTLCDVSSADLEDLIEHLKVVHKKIFHEEYGYGLVPYRLVNESLTCAICNEQFQYFIKLNHHMNEHFGSYVCETCGKFFLSQDRLRCHAIRHGSGYRCNICPETFESLTQKTNHEAKSHNKVLEMKCRYCPETFTSYHARKLHHSEVHNVAMESYNCPVCGKSFQIMSRMKVHLKQVHIREKNFSCSMCDQKFFSKTHVKKHMIKHVGDRIYQCEICMKSYARKQTLRDHMRIHSKDKKFSCSLCSQEFVQNNSLRLHMKVHHPADGGAYKDPTV